MRVKTVREGISSRRFTPCKTDFEQKTETDCFAVYLTSRLVDNLPLLSYIGKFQGSVCFESVHGTVEPPVSDQLKCEDLMLAYRRVLAWRTL